MPIGKNSIKRVANNGYSNVKTAAPDMENSTVTKAQTCAPATKSAEKKVSARPAPSERSSVSTAKKTTKKAQKPAPVSTSEKTADTKPYCNLGDEMPTYLL